MQKAMLASEAFMIIANDKKSSIKGYEEYMENNHMLEDEKQRIQSILNDLKAEYYWIISLAKVQMEKGN